MPCTVEYWADKNIIYVQHSEQTTLKDRLEAKDQIMAIDCPERRILSDVRALSTSMSDEESKQLADAVRYRPSLFRKVAILHRENFNPYVIPISNAVLIGADIEDFTSMEDAIDWLQG